MVKLNFDTFSRIIVLRLPCTILKQKLKTNNMKNIFFLSFFALILFSACSPKTGEVTKKSSELQIKTAEMIADMGEDFRTKSPTPGPAPKIQLGSYEQFELGNGLKVIVVENNKLPRVTFSLSLEADPFMENDHIGAAEIAGQLMSHGTTTRTKAQIDEEVDFMGATLNSSFSGMYAASLKKHTDNLLQVMSDVLLNPGFSAEEFEKVKKQTLSGLASSKDDPNAIAGNVASVLRYGKDHPYGEIVTEETVANITLDNCKDYYKNYYRPNVAYLVVVGDIKTKDAKTLVEKYFSKWQKEIVPTFDFVKPVMPETTTIDFVNKPGAVQSVINVTYPIEFQTGSPDAIKAAVMNTLLGGFFRSRLNGNLREDKGYTYGIRSSLSADKEIGSFSTSAGVRNEVTDSSIIQIIYEMNRLRTETVPQDELDLVKNYLSGSFARSLENPQTVARFALNTIKYKLSSDYYANYLENLSNVSAADLKAMAQKYIKPDNAHFVVVGNKSEVADKLGKIGKVNYYNNYGEEVEDALEIPDGTTAETVIEDYLNAIGGKAQLNMIKDITMKMETDMMGNKLSIDIYVMEGKFANTVSMTGMGVMSRQIYNDGKVMVEQGGQTAPLDEATKAQLKEAAVLFPELKYVENGYKLELTGVEKIDGENAYVVDIESPSGKKSTHFFDLKTSLKVRELQNENGKAIISDLKDYKEVDDIMFPHINILTGMAPVPLNMAVTTISVNKGIDPAVFGTE
ncbi:MAG: zinc protease [Saprospiraceae bacterium]